MAPVFGLRNLGRRMAESVVGLFAVLGFVYVPLGRHTGFEHAKAVLSTPAAVAAFEDLSTTALGLRQRALAFFTGQAVPPPPETSTAELPQARSHGPKAVPPKLK